MVEAVNPCRLLSTSTMDTNKVFEHISMLFICTWGHPYTVTLAKLTQILIIQA
jgi:hypothetical protein